MKNTKQKHRILYHRDNDGRGAALAALWWIDRLKERNPHQEFDVFHYSVQHGEDMPPDLEGAHLHILDFSYPRDVLINLSHRVKTITLIDHHKTAHADLAGIETETKAPMTVIFDTEHSGAHLAWKYYTEDMNDFHIPAIVDYIEDRDMWWYKLENSKEINIALSIHDWEIWLALNPMDLVVEGRAIQAFLDNQAEIFTYTEPRFWALTGDTVPIYNIPGFMASDTLHMALEKYPEAPYAVGYFEIPGKRVYQLRSRGDYDVSEIAERFGGGGHKAAAGFSINLKFEV